MVGLALLVPISEIKVKFFSIIILYTLEMSNYQRPDNGVVPKLVSDINLKRVRIETDDGDAIRVESTNSTDLSPVTDTLGTTEDLSTDNTVIGLLKSIASKLQ